MGSFQANLLIKCLMFDPETGRVLQMRDDATGELVSTHIDRECSPLKPRTTGEIQILLDHPGPKVEPPVKINVEYSKNVSDLSSLKQDVEGLLREKLVFRADVHLVPEGSLPRYEMKAQLIKKLWESQS